MAWFRELKMWLPKRERKGEALDENFLCNGAGIPAPFLYKCALPLAMAWFRELKMRLPKRGRKGGALDENFLCNGAGMPAPFLYKERIAAGNGLVLRT